MNASELILQLQALPWPLLVLIGVAINQMIATIVLSSIDDDEQHLLAWFKDCPSPFLKVLVMQMWPVVAFFWCRNHLSR